MTLSVLYARSDSVYKRPPFELDVYDFDRDATNFDGNGPVIAHPPCRGWGRLRGLSKATEREKTLGLHALNIVRANGGVLEHPESSILFDGVGIKNPLFDPGSIDEFGGFIFPIQQCSFGHKARKNTWLYICGLKPTELPPYPFIMGEAAYVISTGKRTKKWKKEVSRIDREATPFDLALWLYEIVQLIDEKKFNYQEAA